MTAKPWPSYWPAGDAALGVEFGQTIDPAINRQVHALARLLDQAPLPGIIETVPTYCSLLIHYDPWRLSYQEVLAWARSKTAQAESLPPVRPRCLEIPTVYGGRFGPDLVYVAQVHHLSPAEVIRLHSRADYVVYMMGFMPGFPYLGGLPLELETPRLETPRTLVPAGSVGLAGKQTGIYPLASPGGWRLIGYTPLRLFNAEADPPTLLNPGDQVRFVPIPPGALPDGA